MTLAIVIMYNNLELSPLNIHHTLNSPVVVIIDYKASKMKSKGLKKISYVRFITIDQSTFPEN